MQFFAKLEAVSLVILVPPMGKSWFSFLRSFKSLKRSSTKVNGKLWSMQKIKILSFPSSSLLSLVSVFENVLSMEICFFVSSLAFDCFLSNKLSRVFCCSVVRRSCGVSLI